jgi:hypothetical protein
MRDPSIEMKLQLTRPAGVDHELIWGLVAAAFLAVSVLLPVDRLLEGSGYRCPFRALLGVPCPTCGGTRAVAAMGRLEFGRGFAANPLVALAWCGAVLFVPYAAVVVVGGMRRIRLTGLSARDRLLLRALAVGALLTNWAYLILTA